MQTLPIKVEIDPGWKAAFSDEDESGILIEQLQASLGQTYRVQRVGRMRGVGRSSHSGRGSSGACTISLPDIIQVIPHAALGAVTFTTSYKVLAKIIDRNKSRTVSLQMGGKKIRIQVTARKKSKHWCENS